MVYLYSYISHCLSVFKSLLVHIRICFPQKTGYHSNLQTLTLNLCHVPEFGLDREMSIALVLVGHKIVLHIKLF